MLMFMKAWCVSCLVNFIFPSDVLYITRFRGYLGRW